MYLICQHFVSFHFIYFEDSKRIFGSNNTELFLDLDFCLDAQCLKIIQNVAFEFFNFGISTNFWPIKTDLSGNTVWPQASGFQKLAKMDHFWHF